MGKFRTEFTGVVVMFSSGGASAGANYVLRSAQHLHISLIVTIAAGRGELSERQQVRGLSVKHVRTVGSRMEVRVHYRSPTMPTSLLIINSHAAHWQAHCVSQYDGS